jgi:DNA-binding CsgD family transcriptional regulator/tetratricopeptide (TPR) repeat protein
MPELVERAEAMGAVDQLLVNARAGRGGCLFIGGEPGLGKTALLDYACRQAEGYFAVGSGSGDVMEQSLPFGLMSQAIHALGGGEALAPLAADRPPADIRAACFFGVRDWLQRQAARPILFALDDLHWADRDSLGLFHFLCRRVESQPVAVVATMRPWPAEASRAASRLGVGHFPVVVQRLAPLSLEGAGAMLAARLGNAVDEATVRSAWLLCAGNPLLLEQVVGAMSQGLEVLRADQPAGGADDAARAVPDELLLARFAGLPDGALSCARAASVLGSRFRLDQAAAVAQVEPSGRASVQDALIASGLVKADVGMTVEFAHPLVRQALYSSLAAPVRAQLHARAFEVLLAAGREADAAEHAVPADLAGDVRAVAVLERTARTALASGAVERAAKYLSAAARLAGSAVPPALLLDLAKVTLADGRTQDAVHCCQQVLAHPEASGAQHIEAYRVLGRAHAADGATARAADNFDQALRLAELAGPGAAGVILLDQAMTMWRAEGPAVSLPLAERARSLCAAEDPATRRRADSVWGFMALLAGNGSGLQACSDAAEPVARAASAAGPMSENVGDVIATFGWAATIAERLADADRTFADALGAVRDRGWAGPVAALAVGHAHALMRQARLPEAFAAIQQAVDLQDPLGRQDPYIMVGHAWILHLMGEQEQSEAWCARAEELAESAGQRLALLFATDIRGQHALRRGELARAAELYEGADAVARRLGLADPCAVPWAAHAIAASIGAGRPDRARRTIRWLEDAAAVLPCRWPRIAAATGRAWLAADGGDTAGAESEFSEAMRLHAEAALPLARIETLVDFGIILRRIGSPARARPVLAEALRRAEAARCGWFASQARAELALAGGRRRQAPLDPGQLTPAERRVALLAASGRSNQEISLALWISVNTVETHMRRIFTKLNVQSRRELMTRPQLLGDSDDAGPAETE